MICVNILDTDWNIDNLYIYSVINWTAALMYIDYRNIDLNNIRITQYLLRRCTYYYFMIFFLSMSQAWNRQKIKFTLWLSQKKVDQKWSQKLLFIVKN